ncbi:MAG: hypothetical protein WC791_01440 [Candidatus Paceibacterota bacterium]|jgi:hypothetical protein
MIKEEEMKVLSTKPDGSALVEFTNLPQYTNVIGVKEPVRAIVSISEIPKLVRIGQQARRSAQKLSALLAKNQQDEAQE